MKVQVDIDHLEALRKTAIKNDTLKVWSEIAMDWIIQTETEIRRLEKELDKTILPDDNFNEIY